MHIIIAAAFLLIISSAAAFASQEEGIMLFKQGKYQQALECFEQEIANSPSNPGLYVNAAYCEFELGRTSRAKDSAQKVVDEWPDHPAAKEAQRFLDSVKSGRAKKLGDSSPATTSNARPYGGLASGSASTAGTSRAASRGRLIDELMQVTPPSSGRPEVSLAAKVQVRTALTRLPNSILEELKRRNIRVFVTPTLIDKCPELKNREGRGYDGYTYKSCPGMFDGRSIYVCEYTIDENDDSQIRAIDRDKLSSTAYHELGHAIDYILGNLSQSQEYKLSYRQDSASIPEELRSKVSYYLQKAEAGQSESCAELIAAVLGAPDTTGGAVALSFPRTTALLKKKISGPVN